MVSALRDSISDDKMKLRIKNVVRHKTTYEYRRRIPQDLQDRYGKKWISQTMGRLEPEEVAIAANKLNKQYDIEFRDMRANQAKSIAEQPNALHLARFGVNVSQEYEDIYFRLHERVLKQMKAEGVGYGIDERIFALATPAERAVLEMKTRLSEVLKADEQLKSMGNRRPLELVVEKFINLFGDIAVEDLERQHFRTFIKQSFEDGLEGSSIARNIGPLKAMISRYYIEKDLEPPTRLWKGLKIEGARHSIDDRNTLTVEQIAKIDAYMLKQESEGSKTPRHYALYWLIRNSTLGIGEACGLEQADVVLNCDVPHVFVRANSLNGLKTEYRPRRYPLVGEALKRAKHLPTSEMDKRTKGNQLNEMMREAVPTLLKMKETLYSFRHTQKVVLNKAGATDDQRMYLFGHSPKSSHGRYGAAHPDLGELHGLVKRATSFLNS